MAGIHSKLNLCDKWNNNSTNTLANVLKITARLSGSNTPCYLSTRYLQYCYLPNSYANMNIAFYDCRFNPARVLSYFKYSSYEKTWDSENNDDTRRRTRREHNV